MVGLDPNRIRGEQGVSRGFGQRTGTRHAGQWNDYRGAGDLRMGHSCADLCRTEGVATFSYSSLGYLRGWVGFTGWFELRRAAVELMKG